MSTSSRLMNQKAAVMNRAIPALLTRELA